MIREAVEADRFAILRMGKEFIGSLGMFPFDAPYAERTVKQYIDDPDKLCLVFVPGKVARGMLLAHCAPHPFWPVKVATELAWWIDPDHRGSAALRMITAFEEWAVTKGCALAGLAHLGDEKVGRLYERRGYSPAEHLFLKRLG